MPPVVKRIHSWRNAILGTLLVLAGLGTAFLTIIARRNEDPALTTASAIISLVIALLIIVLVLPPLARAARKEAARIDLPLEITGGGMIFIGILVVVGFAAWNSGNNLLFLIFSVLVSTLFVAWTAGRASLGDLSVTARFPDHIFAGETAPVIVIVHNRKRVWPSFSVLIEARGPLEGVIAAHRKRRKARLNKRALAYFPYIPHKSGAEQRVEQSFDKRGHVIISGFELSTKFPFGFYRLRRRLRARDVDIVVYPRVQPVDDELHLLPMNAGRVASARKGFGHELLALRDYQPQDDLRHIDWKATARTRRLTVREFTSEDERRVTIALDTTTRLQDRPNDFGARFEEAVVIAASLVAHFIAEGVEVRLFLGDEKGNFGANTDHLHACLRRLALVEAKPDAEMLSKESVVVADPDSALSARPGKREFVIFITSAPQGTIPSAVWRTAHVIYF
jgi:uncharacterized protein (DUF58 family)